MTDVSARTTLKGAAKNDKRCELQDSVNQQKVNANCSFFFETSTCKRNEEREKRERQRKKTERERRDEERRRERKDEERQR